MVCAVLAAAALLYGISARDRSFFDADTAQYLGVAESLLAGEGYRFDARPQTKFPPGVSLAYLPTLAAFGRDFVWVFRTTVCYSLAALAAAFVWWGARGERSRGLLLVVSAGSLTWFEFSLGASLSEMPFALATFVALALAERGFAGRPLAVAGFAGAVVAAVLTRTAGVALVVGIAATLVWRWRSLGVERLGFAVGALAGAVALLGWVAWSAAVREPFFSGDLGSAATYAATYVDQIIARSPHEPDLGRASVADLAWRLLANAQVQLAHTGEILSNLPWLPARGITPIAGIGAGIVGLGLVAELRRANPLAGGTTLATVALLLVWPFDEGRRFLAPLVPVIFTFAAAGAVWADEIARSRPLWLLMGALALSLTALAFTAVDSGFRPDPAGSLERGGRFVWIGIALAASAGLALGRGGAAESLVRRLPSLPRLAPAFVGVYLLVGACEVPEVFERHHERSGPMRQTPARHASEWLAREATKGSRVMATDWDAIHFATGLATVPLPVTRDAEKLRLAIALTRPDYLVINAPRPHEYLNPTDGERLEILLREAPGGLAQVWRSDAVSVLRVDPEAFAPPRSP
ncbi:hypothetical protein MYXO_02551 [Myxococcaceae bacterium]|nr:hypothetical protein MYXO_02551 [Myxococcaceae bacterium]